MNNPEILTSKLIFRGKHFEVKEIELLLASGKKIKEEVVERQQAVVVFPLTDKYELHLIHEYRAAVDKKVLKAVSGHIDPGETPLAAAKRELKEETGFEAAQWELLTKIYSVGSISSRTYIFLAKDLERLRPSPQEDEVIHEMRLPLQEAVAKVLTGEIMPSSTIIGILWLDRLKRERKL